MSKEIEVQLSNLFQKNHSETTSFHQEELEGDELQSGQEVRFECHMCKETFKSLRDMRNHNHQDRNKQPSRYHMSVSKDFVQNAEQHGVKYDFEVFQRTFFTENEREASKKSGRNMQEAKISERIVHDNIVSEDFKDLTQKQGINYNIDSFQKAFKFSNLELEASAKKNINQESSPTKLSSLEDYKSLKTGSRMTINEEFLETLRGDGIEYNLGVFQRVFGCNETTNDESNNKEGQNAKDVESGKLLDCKQCGVRFRNRNNFLRHTKAHIPKDKSLFCETCAKSFKTSACLQIHLATNHGRNEGPFDCPICFKSYQDRSALRSHFYIHNMERSFLCGR